MKRLFGYVFYLLSVTFTAHGQEIPAAIKLDGLPTLSAALKAQMGPFLETRDAKLLDWDHSGSGLLISTRFASAYQIHHLRAPGAARRQQTFYREPVNNASYVPGSNDRYVVVQIDEGGNENYQLRRFDRQTGQSILLTDSKSRTNSFVVSQQGLLAFSNNKRNGRDFDIYITDPTPPSGGSNKSTMVYEAKGQFSPVHFSADGSKLLLAEFISQNQAYFHIYDTASKTTRPLFADEMGKMVAYRDGRFSADGKGLFFTSDRDGEFVQLYYYDFTTQQIQSLTKQIPWNITQLTIDAPGRRVAFVANVDGQSALYVMETHSDTKRNPPQSVPIPSGIISSLEFSHKNRDLIGMTLDRPTAPKDVYAYDLARKKLIRWTESEIGGLREEQFIEPQLIRYKTFDGRAIPTFVYRPAKRTKAKRSPVLVFIHGGPEAQYQPNFSPLIQYLVSSLGYAVVAPNVRGSDGYGKSYLLLDNGAKREDSVRDIGKLLDWIKTQPDLDATHVVVYGGSYGGYMVLASLSHFGDRLKAGVDIVGISHFVTFLENTKAYRRDLRRAEYGDERNVTMRKLLHEISPLTQVSRLRRPLLVVQGANDPRVPASEAEQIVKAVRKNGQRVWYLLAGNEGHGFQKKENRDIALLYTIAFLQSLDRMN